MKRPALLLILVFCLSSASAQSPQSYFRAVCAAVSGDSLNANLLKFEQLGIKEENSQAIENTRLWLQDKYNSYGFADVYLDTFIYLGDTLYNVIADKKGAIDSNSWVIVCGHYDTEGGPGVNDNGSGVASILEIARIIESIPTYYSVRFINFASEEDGFKGSIHYVTQKVVPQNMQIRVVFNLDEIGAVAGITNTTVTCERDEGGQTANNAASYHFTNVLDTMMRRYGEINTQIGPAFLSDYIPFELNGYVITGLYETNVTPFRHTINDSLKNLDTAYVRKLTKGAVAATLKFAGVDDQGKGLKPVKVNTYTVFPNPAESEIFFISSGEETADIIVSDLHGRVIYRGELKEKALQISDYTAGAYFYRISGKTVQTGSFIKR